MNRRLVVLVTVAIIAIFVISALVYLATNKSAAVQNASQAPVVAPISVGLAAPTFQAASTGGPFDLAQTKKPVFLEVFATWCPHCQRQTAVINRLYAKYGHRVAFIAVSGSDTGMDQGPASQADVMKFVELFNVQYPTAFDGSLSVAKKYLQGGFPTTVIIDSNKKIVYINSGEIAEADLAEQLEKVR